MRFRHNPLPRRLDEVLCFLSVGFLLPIVFVYDIIVVLPSIYELGSFPYILTLLSGAFLLINAEGNLIACMLLDTSVDPSWQAPPEGTKERLNWRQCTICDRLAPPRSWHCKECGVCILKRDHHCTFTACCIGHLNQRYFLCFLLHLLVGSFFALIYSSFYTWVLNGSRYWKVIITRSLFTFPLSNFGIKVELLIYALHILVFVSPLFALSYYVPIIRRGGVCGEKVNQHSYDNGLLLNLRSIFGKQMHLVWLSPWVESALPEDGYNWNSNSIFNSTKKSDI